MRKWLVTALTRSAYFRPVRLMKLVSRRRAGLPEEIQALCRWQSPDSLRAYVRWSPWTYADKVATTVRREVDPLNVADLPHLEPGPLIQVLAHMRGTLLTRRASCFTPGEGMVCSHESRIQGMDRVRCGWRLVCPTGGRTSRGPHPINEFYPYCKASQATG